MGAAFLFAFGTGFSIKHADKSENQHTGIQDRIFASHRVLVKGLAISPYFVYNKRQYILSYRIFIRVPALISLASGAAGGVRRIENRVKIANGAAAVSAEAAHRAKASHWGTEKACAGQRSASQKNCPAVSL